MLFQVQLPTCFFEEKNILLWKNVKNKNLGWITWIVQLGRRKRTAGGGPPIPALLLKFGSNTTSIFLFLPFSTSINQFPIYSYLSYPPFLGPRIDSNSRIIIFWKLKMVKQMKIVFETKFKRKGGMGDPPPAVRFLLPSCPIHLISPSFRFFQTFSKKKLN